MVLLNTRLVDCFTLWYCNERRENVFPTSLLNRILSPATNITKPPKACQWATVMSRLLLKNIWSRKTFDALKITACVQCRLFINTEAPWLGASPDCLLHNSAEPTSFGIGEVKSCPFSKKEMTIQEACKVDYSFFA